MTATRGRSQAEVNVMVGVSCGHTHTMPVPHAIRRLGPAGGPTHLNTPAVGCRSTTITWPSCCWSRTGAKSPPLPTQAFQRNSPSEEVARCRVPVLCQQPAAVAELHLERLCIPAAAPHPLDSTRLGVCVPLEEVHARQCQAAVAHGPGKVVAAAVDCANHLIDT